MNSGGLGGGSGGEGIRSGGGEGARGGGVSFCSSRSLPFRLKIMCT